MKDDARKRLIRAALQARNHAVAPYSGFKVGAAIVTQTGKVFTGANVESASYGLTCCAERVTLFKALTAGASAIRAVAVVARIEDGPMPCGACRQLLAEYAPDADVLAADSAHPSRWRKFTVAELLPEPFSRLPDPPRKRV